MSESAVAASQAPRRLRRAGRTRSPPKQALPPEGRDEIVTEAIDDLQDLVLREQRIAEEEALHAEIRAALRAKLDGEVAS